MAHRKLCLFTVDPIHAASNALFAHVRAMFANVPRASGYAGLAVEVDE